MIRFRYFPRNLAGPNPRGGGGKRAEKRRRREGERDFRVRAGWEGRYKGSNLPALNERRLRRRSLGTKLAYVVGVGQRGRLPEEVGGGEAGEGRRRCSER
jgi:hypothetical protein